MADKKNEDLFDMLAEEFRKHCEAQDLVDGGKGHLFECVDAFTTFCRERLKKNPVVTTYTLENGLGLRFQDHKTVPLVRPNLKPLPRDAVAITMPESAPGMEGVSERWSMPISKGG